MNVDEINKEKRLFGASILSRCRCSFVLNLSALAAAAAWAACSAFNVGDNVLHAKHLRRYGGRQNKIE